MKGSDIVNSIKLIKQKASNIELISNVPSENMKKQLTIETSFNYHVDFADDLKHCKAYLQYDIIAQGSPDTLKMHIDMEGLFEVDMLATDADKKLTHVQCYPLLFPYVQMCVVQMCIWGGLPPLLIPQAEINVDDVELHSSDNV